MGIPLGRYFDDHKARVTAFTQAVLAYPPLPRFLLLLAFEFGTRRHYVESVRDHTEERGDPLYVDVLQAHWLEEAQHVKSDMLEVAQLARGLSPEALREAFEQVLGLGGARRCHLRGSG